MSEARLAYSHNNVDGDAVYNACPPRDTRGEIWATVHLRTEHDGKPVPPTYTLSFHRGSAYIGAIRHTKTRGPERLSDRTVTRLVHKFLRKQARDS